MFLLGFSAMLSQSNRQIGKSEAQVEPLTKLRAECERAREVERGRDRARASALLVIASLSRRRARRRRLLGNLL